METVTEVARLIECPECGAIAGDARSSGHLRWMYCGNCEASWRTGSERRPAAPSPVPAQIAFVV